MKHIIIGTAGHIDHGKTALIKALTGTDTDRLKEEKQRGITIELGFTSFVLPDGTRAGIIDVPGHEKFVGNMVTGVIGMDLVLLLVAADEGIMPQTREHMAILQQLGVSRGILVLSKCDLVDQEWKELVKEDIRKELAGTCFEAFPVAEVSAVTGQGIPELVELIQKLTAQSRERETAGMFRLPVDRVFSVTGFGTVVTGTLISGTLRKGEDVVIYPSGRPGRVRGLQVYGQEVDTACAGQRTAVNLQGVEKKELRRGDVLAPPGSMEASGLLDVRLEHGSFSSRELPNRVRLHLSIGTDQLLCRAVLLNRDSLKPGESCYAQLLLERPLAVCRGDRFILRFYSPVETVGGGIVLDAHAVKRKRFRQEDIQELQKKEKGTPGETLELLAKKKGRAFLSSGEILKTGIMTQQELAEAAEELEAKGLLLRFFHKNEQYFLARQVQEELLARVLESLREFHRLHPYQRGIRKAELQTRIFRQEKPGSVDALLEIWEQQEVLRRQQEYISEFSFQIPRDKTFQKVRQKLCREFRKAGFDFVRYSDITLGETPRETADDIFQICLEEGLFVKLTDNLYTLTDIAEDAVDRLLPLLQAEGRITIIQARDLLGSSRKSIKPLFEYMDSQRITRKNGTESEREAVL
ncbi:MAG: selenocysteine-specific translation elongation factor [Lachnospiraceae bacterium]|nr:selenocysteine-specific translation elongation factor [Lachnospiraceae bacterium]